MNESIQAVPEPSKRGRRLWAKVLGVGLVASASVVGTATGTVDAGWDHPSNTPAVVTCYSGYNTVYGGVKEYRAALVNNTGRTWRLKTEYVRNGNHVYQNHRDVRPGVWGYPIKGSVSRVYQDTAKVSWVPLNRGDLRGSAGHVTYTYSRVDNISRC